MPLTALTLVTIDSLKIDKTAMGKEKYTIMLEEGFMTVEDKSSEGI